MPAEPAAAAAQPKTAATDTDASDSPHADPAAAPAQPAMTPAVAAAAEHAAAQPAAGPAAAAEPAAADGARPPRKKHHLLRHELTVRTATLLHMVLLGFLTRGSILACLGVWRHAPAAVAGQPGRACWRWSPRPPADLAVPRGVPPPTHPPTHPPLDLHHRQVETQAAAVAHFGAATAEDAAHVVWTLKWVQTGLGCRAGRGQLACHTAWSRRVPAPRAPRAPLSPAAARPSTRPPLHRCLPVPPQAARAAGGVFKSVRHPHRQLQQRWAAGRRPGGSAAEDCTRVPTRPLARPWLHPWWCCYALLRCKWCASCVLTGCLPASPLAPATLPAEWMRGKLLQGEAATSSGAAIACSSSMLPARPLVPPPACLPAHSPMPALLAHLPVTTLARSMSLAATHRFAPRPRPPQRLV